MCQWRYGSGAARRTRVNTFEQGKLVFTARASLGIFLFGCGLTIAGCRPAADINSSSQPATVSSPPFSTEEPQRYQATRTTTFSESQSNANPFNQRTTNVLIARDGGLRREAYETVSQGQIVLLENNEGSFVLLPQAKLYADANQTEAVVAMKQPNNPVVTPDLLLHETATTSQFQKLGAETINGRAATKYRVTTSAAGGASVESFIWVDEALGLPIRSESVHSAGEHTSRVVMELRDIRTDVDPQLFLVPADYRKVMAHEILELIHGVVTVPNADKPQK